MPTGFFIWGYMYPFTFIFGGTKKINSVFTVTCQKNLVSVGRDIFFYYVIGRTGNSRSRFRYFIFEKNDELCSFSTFFALNFDKKLAVE